MILIDVFLIFSSSWVYDSISHNYTSSSTGTCSAGHLFRESHRLLSIKKEHISRPSTGDNDDTAKGHQQQKTMMMMMMMKWCLLNMENETVTMSSPCDHDHHLTSQCTVLKILSLTCSARSTNELSWRIPRSFLAAKTWRSNAYIVV